MKKVGIIGSGQVGIALARGFNKYGYQVAITSRSEEKRKHLQDILGQGVDVLDTPELLKKSELIIFAVKGSKAKEAVGQLDAEQLKGKTVVDTTNPITDGGPDGAVLRYFTEQNTSLMEELQSALPETHFVKAFSCVGNNLMVNPGFQDRPSMFICGNNEDAKRRVGRILERFGWEVEDLGDVKAARAIEPLAMLWCIPGFLENRWDHALKLLKK